MMDFVAAFQHWLTLACFVALAVCLFALAVLCAIPELTDAIRRFCGMDNFSKVVCGVCIVGAVLYGGSKGVNVRWDDGLRDNGTLITNDTVAVRWTYSGIPGASSVFIDYREAGSTNKWLNLAETLASAQSWTGTLANATNYDYWVYSTYVPPVPVHTNGVWVGQAYETKARVGAKSFLILNGLVQEHGRTIAPPKWAEPYVPTAADYIQDGLIAMWDGIENAGWGTHDPNATVWKDLVGGFDATPSGTPTFGGDYTITSDGYWVLPNQILGSINTGDITAEAVFRASRTSGTGNQGIIGIGNNRAIWLFFGNSPLSNTSSLNWQYKNGGTVRVWFNMGAFGTDIHTSTMMVASNLCNCFLDSVKRTITEDVQAGTGNSTGNCDLGRIVGFNRFYGETYNIRIYNRALTTEEIEHNYEIDKERFNLP